MILVLPLLVLAAAHERAHRLGPARAALARAIAIAGDDAAFRVGQERETYHHVLGLIERQEGHAERALAQQRLAPELRTRRVGPGDASLAPIRAEIAALEKRAR